MLTLEWACRYLDAFVAAPALDWAAQVTVVDIPPAHHHLAAAKPTPRATPTSSAPDSAGPPAPKPKRPRKPRAVTEPR
jgi:hypothetical protein